MGALDVVETAGTVPNALGLPLNEGGAAGEEETGAVLSLTFPNATAAARNGHPVSFLSLHVLPSGTGLTVGSCTGSWRARGRSSHALLRTRLLRCWVPSDCYSRGCSGSCCARTGRHCRGGILDGGRGELRLLRVGSLEGGDRTDGELGGGRSGGGSTAHHRVFLLPSCGTVA